VQRTFAVSAAIAALLVSASGSQAAGSAIHPRFAYDRNRPLDLRLGQTQSSGGIVQQRLTFDAGRGPRTGFWTHPDGRGPWPVVLFSPGSGGDATSQLPDADRLARRGLASLTVDPPRVLWSCRSPADVRTYSAYVVGRRRALDLIPHLPGADSSRVAAVGFSFGSAVTAALAGVDHRLRGAVIQSGRAHLSAPIAGVRTRPSIPCTTSRAQLPRRSSSRTARAIRSLRRRMLPLTCARPVGPKRRARIRRGTSSTSARAPTSTTGSCSS
jgi:predicted dienelactone hydrolase